MMQAAPVSILIADDHFLVRVGIRALIERLPHFCVVGEAANAAEAVAQLDTLKPAIVLLDISMPDQSGIEAAPLIHASGARVIMLSAMDGAEYVLSALKAGASGYLVKDLLLNELELALESVSRGDVYLSPRIAHHVIASMHPVVASTPETEKASLLTGRQKEVLAGIARGLSTKQIAREMNISPKTVEFHRAQIIERLGVRDVAGLVRQAARLGLVSLD